MKTLMALAVAGALIFGLASFAAADESVQTEEAKVKPNKIKKKKHQNVTLINTITTFNDPALGQPKSAERTILDLPKQMKFNTGGVNKCKTNEAGLEAAATTSDAIKACGKKSLVSNSNGSVAQVTVGAGPGLPPITVLDIEVSAFNEDGKKLLLYSKPIGSASGIPASILVGKLKKFNKVNGRPAGATNGKPYKESLDVSIPPLAAGAISLFKVQIPKSAKYVKAKCKPKTMEFRATTFFSDGTSTFDSTSHKCKPK